MTNIELLQLVSVLVSDLVCPVLIAAALCVGVYFQVRKYYEDKQAACDWKENWEKTMDVWKQQEEARVEPTKPSRKRK